MRRFRFGSNTTDNARLALKLGAFDRAEEKEAGVKLVHNHGTEEGPGLACRETRLPDGRLIGDCLRGAERRGEVRLTAGGSLTPAVRPRTAKGKSEKR